MDGKTYTTTHIDTEETPAFGYKYKYDALGNITDIYEGTKSSDGSYTYDTDNMIHYRYTYDDYNQLKTARDPNAATVTSYTYDTDGNITSKTIRGWDLEENAAVGIIESDTYTYGDSQWGDLLTAYNGQAITYDTIGNPLTYRDGITMTWQNGRKLATFTNEDEGIEATFTYDPSGMRTKKQIANLSTTEYVYENGLLLKMKYGTYLFSFSYDANGSPIGFKLSRTNSTTADTYYYYGLNRQGDVVALYNASGTRIASYSYDAYGKPLNTQILLAGHTTAININPLRYRGYVYDKETGLYYLQSRYYDPETCRFINPDVYYNTGVGLTGYNMFAYCNNNPVQSADPTGEREILGWSVQDETSYEVSLSVACEYEPIDITQKLNNEMTNNKAYLVDFATNYSYAGAVAVFAIKEYTGGDWDLKAQPEWNLVPNRNYLYNDTILRYDDIGNIHYGYVGRVLFDTNTLLSAGGVIQCISGSTEFDMVKMYLDDPQRWDDPRDQWAIEYGCKIWDKGIGEDMS